MADHGLPNIVFDPNGDCPVLVMETCDLALTVRSGAPWPWVTVRDLRRARAILERNVARSPVATAALLHRLRSGECESRMVALSHESETFSALLGGAGFQRWLKERGPMTAGSLGSDPQVHYERCGDLVTLTLDDPSNLNAYSAAMRDALADKLDACLDDPTAPLVTIEARGRAFCTGGLLSEFGKATDPVDAHRIRMEQSAAVRLWKLAKRASVMIRGPAIGSGIEIAACAARVSATAESWFQLPELQMGLIPGAGGMVSIPGRIGRHRTAWMVLSGARISAQQALAWGLIDEIVAR